jgi:hypothetical protein
VIVRFLRDFRSAATGEVFYEAGAVADLPEGAAIVAEGAAEPVTVEPPPPPSPPKPRKQRREQH